MQVRIGTTRVVVLISRFAVKFPKIDLRHRKYGRRIFLKGLLANLEEKFWYKAYCNSDKVTKVYFTSLFGFVQVSQRAEPLTKEEYDCENMESLFKGYPLDNKIENFGKINGKIVLVDYADSTYMCSGCEERIDCLTKEIKRSYDNKRAN